MKSASLFHDNIKIASNVGFIALVAIVKMEGFREYLAVYAFKNESDPQLDLTVNDIIEVPIGNSQLLNVDVPGWIKGKNKRTGMEGYYPGTNDLKNNKLLNFYIGFYIHCCTDF